MEKLLNKKTNVLATVLNRTEDSVILLVNGEEKTYSNSTIKRWWKQIVETTQQTSKEVVKKVTQTSDKTILDEVSVSEQASTLIKKITAKSRTTHYTTKNTRYYVAIKSGNKTKLEIHFNKNGKTWIVMRPILAAVLSKRLSEEKSKFTQAPATYKWTLNTTLDITEFTEKELGLIASHL